MKETIIQHSIGEALQACAGRVPSESVRVSAGAVRVSAETVGVPTQRRPSVPQAAAAAGEQPSQARLTARQLEVLALLCEGLPNKVICRRLNIATGTVKVHISSIFRELGVVSRLQAVVESRRRGLLVPAPDGAAGRTAETGGPVESTLAARVAAAVARRRMLTAV